jgi:hypothetical protein
LICAATAHATYNSNLAGTVTSIATYTNGMVLFSLANQPTSNGSCNATNFEVDVSDTVSDAAFNRMYARLAEAYALGETVNVGYDNTGSCAISGYIQVYRIG